MRNYFLVTIGLFFCIHLSGQSLYLDGITLSNSAFGYYDETGIIVANSSPVSLTVGSVGNYELTANRVIELKRGFYATAGSSTTNHFKAEIGNQGLDVVILEPETITAVPLYNKVEFGISVPSLETRINRFLNDNTGNYKPGTDRYNDSLESGYLLNPYDPIHISVDAVFFKPSSPNNYGVIKHGFFYDEYERITSPIKDWDPTHAGIDPYEWRVRFAPDELGTWRGFIHVYVNDVLLPENYFFTFTVVSGDNPGFVEVNDDNTYKQFLRYSNGEQFFPVGDNNVWQLPHSDCYPSCITNNCVNADDGRIYGDFHDEAVEYIDKLTLYGNGGGNNSRFALMPDGMEIEWDRLGNYHPRQIEMFELDEYLKYCEDNDVYLIINAFTSVEYRTEENPWHLPNYTPGWEWNPYNNSNTLTLPDVNDPNRKYKGIDSVVTFYHYLTNSDAQIFAKNKLRYIDARWGYSTSFYILELFQEIGAYPDYWDSTILNDKMEDWLGMMADYAKNDLNMKQLITSSYLGEGYLSQGCGPDSPNVTTLWADPNIDMVSGHSYNQRLDALGGKTRVLRNSFDIYNKPCIYTEYDKGNYGYLTQCNTLGIYNQLWSSAFSGSCGPGMAWVWRRYLIDDWYNATVVRPEESYKTIRSYFSDNVDILNYNYETHHTIKYYTGSTDSVSRFENFYMVRDDKKKAYGWFYNRSHNEYTYGNCDYFEHASLDLNDDCVTAIYQSTQDLIDDNAYAQQGFDLAGDYYHDFFQDSLTHPIISSQLKFDSLLPYSYYTIEFMYTNGPDAGIFDTTFNIQFGTGPNGEGYILNGPPTGYTSPTYYPWDWAYVVHLSNEPRSVVANHIFDHEADSIISQTKHSNNTTATQNVQDNVTSHHGRQEINPSVIPNPNDGNFYVQFTYPENKQTNTLVSDIYGNILSSRMLSLYQGKNIINFSMPELAAGTYFVKIEGIDQVFKIIIVK